MTHTTALVQTILAVVLSVVFLITFPLAGAIGCTWAAVTIVTPSPEPEPDPDDAQHKPHRCGLSVIPLIIMVAVVAVVSFIVGGVVGLGIAGYGVVLLSAWAMHGWLTNDKADE